MQPDELAFQSSSVGAVPCQSIAVFGAKPRFTMSCRATHRATHDALRSRHASPGIARKAGGTGRGSIKVLLTPVLFGGGGSGAGCRPHPMIVVVPLLHSRPVAPVTEKRVAGRIGAHP